MSEYCRGYDSGIVDARLTLRAWLGGNRYMMFGEDRDVMWSWCLAHAVTVGAALCRSFELGEGIEVGEWQRIERSRTVCYIPAPLWKPGCKEPAP